MNTLDFLHYGDILATPFFLIAFIYFYKKTNRTLLVNLLLIFTLIGFIFDMISSFHFLLKHREYIL